MTDHYADEAGYDDLYGDRHLTALGSASLEEYTLEFENRFARPFCEGAWAFGGTALRQALKQIDTFAEVSGRPRHELRILDAGSGMGYSSVYLAARGYDVTGIEISNAGVLKARELAATFGLQNCRFEAASLDDTGLPDQGIDIIYGRNTLHHFIKYPNVAHEFRRIVKPGGMAIFIDPFGENVFKNLMQDKEKMRRLGDVLLTKPLIEEFFAHEQVTLTPFDWFGMLDKLLIKAMGWRRYQQPIRRFGRVTLRLDQRVGQEP
jgi:SAM-dependent methyltransferase